MKLGVVFPQTEIGNDPIAIRDYAQTAEGLGYDYLLAYEHVVGASLNRPGFTGFKPYNIEHAFHEPFVLFGYLAGLTTTLEMATGILILPQRQTVLVAKQAASLDVISGGRFRLGIGVGWNDVEYDVLGQDFSVRGRRSEEQIRLMRDLWANPEVNFHGEFDTVTQVGLNPRPINGDIPIWFGGGADAVLRRMARHGQGWMVNRLGGDSLKRMIDKVHGYLLDEGRNPADFGLDGRISWADTAPASWAANVQAWRDLGFTHLGLNTMGAGFETPQQHINAISDFIKTITDKA